VRIALVNPPWSFAGSIYFGCREPHLPLEYGYARALLACEGHEVEIVDAQLFGEGGAWIRRRLEAFRPDMTVVTTAPSYLFWRCAPPELRVPMQTIAAVRDVAGTIVAVGPHVSTTPRAALAKTRADVGICGECEDVLVKLAATPRERWSELASVVRLEGGELRGSTKKNATDMKALPAIRWSPDVLARHRHHHHRFDATPDAPGAELEASRGCPYRCTFCAKQNFRDGFRKRPLDVVMDELDGLVAGGAKYVYFIDEIFVPDRKLLEAIRARDVVFGVQMRIDNWSKEMLDLLGAAGCVSIEAGMESITERGRSLLAKHCKLSTEELTELLVHAKKSVPFVQANLLDATTDKKSDVEAWRSYLRERGVWANEPVPLFPYPGSPEYTIRFGACDDEAWERAHAHYLAQFDAFSDIQETRPSALRELERAAVSRAHG
jgi:B12-binding domain/radical SAM domain protein of rhizo-twelve system